MIGTIRKHQQWLWAVIITATIVSFVVYFSPDAKWGRGTTTEGNYGTIGGRPITREEMAESIRETHLRYFFNYGQWPGRDAKQMGFDIDREALNRLFVIDKLKQMGVQVGDDAAAQWIADNFRDRQHVFRKENYDKFVREVLPQAGLGLQEKDLQSFVRHEVGVQHLIVLTGQTGRLITQKEAEEVYRQENEPVSAEVVFFSVSNHLDQVKVTPEGISQFFTNRMANYRLPERVQVNYVKWSRTNFYPEVDADLAKNTNFSFQVDGYYAQRGAEAFRDTNNVVLAPDAAKAKIRNDMRQELALLEARKKASAFAVELFERLEKLGDKVPKSVDQLDKLAAEKGLKVEITEPFSRSDEPAGLKVLESFARTAFALTPDEPFSQEPLVGEDGVYVIALNKRVPSEVPPLDTIRAKLTEDYRRSEALQAAQAEGAAFHTALTNGLATGKSIDVLWIQSKAPSVRLAPFSRATRSVPEFESHGGDLAELKNLAFSLAPGKVSEFVFSRDGGFVLHVINRLPVDETKMKTEWKEFMGRLQEQRQYDAFQEWFRRERELAHIETAQTSAGKSVKK